MHIIVEDSLYVDYMLGSCILYEKTHELHTFVSTITNICQHQNDGEWRCWHVTVLIFLYFSFCPVTDTLLYYRPPNFFVWSPLLPWRKHTKVYSTTNIYCVGNVTVPDRDSLEKHFLGFCSNFSHNLPMQTYPAERWLHCARTTTPGEWL